MQKSEYHFTSVDSTNSWAKRNASQFKKNELVVVSADTQTAGRARGGEKSWHAPSGNLYLSFVFHSSGISAYIYSQMAALSIEKLLHSHGITAQLKWPNDIVVNSKKIAGILTEVQGDLIIVGIGLNVNMDESELKKIPKTATSMLCETKITSSVTHIQKELVDNFSAFLSEKESTISIEYRSKLEWMIGKTFSFTDGTGKVIRIEKDFSLIIELPDGSTNKIVN